MRKVKNIFFITEEESKQLRKDTGDQYIDHKSPCFELEDGTMIYGKIGYPAGAERWYGEADKNTNGNGD